jgi:hypothetical protein
MSLIMIFTIVAVFIGVACFVGGLAVMIRPEGGTAVEDRLQILTGLTKSAGRGESEEGALLAQMYGDSPNFLSQFVERIGNLNRLLEQADTKLDSSKFFLLTGGLAVAGMVIPAALGLHVAI